MWPIIISVYVFSRTSWALPAPQTSSSSTRINLGLSSSVNQIDVASKLALIDPLTNQKLAAIASSANQFGDITNSASQQLANLEKVQVNVTIQPPFPDSGRTKAVPETENKLSMLDSLYSYAHQFVSNLFNRKPIVDTIKEHEKYGNDGDKYRSVGTAVVNGFEGLSNFLNSAVEVPFTFMRQFTRKATSTLNEVGGRLVGL